MNKITKLSNKHRFEGHKVPEEFNYDIYKCKLKDYSTKGVALYECSTNFNEMTITHYEVHIIRTQPSLNAKFRPSGKKINYYPLRLAGDSEFGKLGWALPTYELALGEFKHILKKR